MNKDFVVSALLGIVLMVSLVQGWQLSSLSGKLGDLSSNIKEVKLTVAAPLSQAPTTGSSGAAAVPLQGNVQVPANIANLPSQVGGC